MENNGHLSKIENPNSFAQAWSWPFESTLESKGLQRKNLLQFQDKKCVDPNRDLCTILQTRARK